MMLVAAIVSLVGFSHLDDLLNLVLVIKFGADVSLKFK
jgi:hypothetical protein